MCSGSPPAHGVRAGLHVGVATVWLTGTAYLFHTIAIRWLGAERYGDLAAMLALVTLVGVAFSSIQGGLAREVAYLRQQRDPEALRAFIRSATVRLAQISIALTAVALIAAPAIQAVLGLGSIWTAIFGAFGMLAVSLGVSISGIAQGLQRFRALTMAYFVSGFARPLLVLPVLALGLGAAGATGRQHALAHLSPSPSS